MASEKASKKGCKATVESLRVEGHTHTCTGDHVNECHYCQECSSWWWGPGK